MRWFSQAHSRQLPVSGPLLLEKAEQLAHGLGMADFKATNGWLERWKTRNGIQFKKQHGEKQDADDFSAERWIVEVLPGILKDYTPRDIFNADETGLYWRATPDGTLSFKGMEAPGSKVAKDRMTLLLACNMDGTEKLAPLVIGKSKNPRCFKNVKKLPVDYEGNKNAWMTADIWKDWLRRVDNKMRSQKRKIIMLCDNCAAHAEDIQLMNVKLAFLPPNTSLIQPMDQGIIANFKKQYRSLVLRRLVNDIDAGESSGARAAEMAQKLTALDSLHMQCEAWNRITQATIANCYRRASFVLSSDGSDDEEENRPNETEVYVPPGMAADDFERYAAVDADLSTEDDISETDIVSAQQPSDDQLSDNNDDDDDDDDVTTEPVSFAVAKQSLENIRKFMEQKGCASYEEFYKLEAAVNGLHHDNAEQSSIFDFFARL